MRLRVYLTNALEPPRDFDRELDFMFEALAQEARAANRAKAIPATIVIGNPPYAGHSQNNNVPWIVDKVYDYKRDWPDLLRPGQGKWLQDDYVKFIRYAQARVVEAGVGVMGYVTNHSFLDNPTFKGCGPG
jgi:predicted helicase